MPDRDTANTNTTQRTEARTLSLLVFTQMLAATTLIPAIRPLFAELHASDESAMHAFMSLNMLGAVIAALVVGALIDRGVGRGGLLAVFAIFDGILLVQLAQPLPTWSILVLRTLEGACHVGAATVLLSRAADLAARGERGRVMGMMGAALIFAVAFGSALGGLLVRGGTSLPFFVGGALAWIVAGWVALRPSLLVDEAPRARRERLSLRQIFDNRDLVVPTLAAFLGRFTVGTVVVTFALFAHKQHELSDSHIGFLFSALTFSFALFMYPAGRLTDRSFPALLLACGGLVYALSLVALGYVPRWALAPLLIAAGCGSAVLFSTTLCYAAYLAPARSRGVAMAWINAAGCLGMLLGPAAAGITSALVRSSTGDPVAGYRAAFLLGGGSLLVWLAFSLPWFGRRLQLERRSAPHVLGEALEEVELRS